MSSSEVHKHRQHPVAALISSVRSIPQLIPVLIVALFSGGMRNLSWTVSLFGIFMALGSIAGIAQWWRLVYWVEQGELRIERGLFVRRRAYIPASRIQAFDISQGLLQRPFGLVRLQIKTAAAGTQAELAAVSRADVQRLRTLLQFDVDASSSIDTPPARYALSPKELLLAASTSGQLGVLLSGLLWLYSQVDEFVEERIVAWLQSGAGIGIVPSGWLIALVLLTGLLLAWLLSILAVVVRFGGFSVERRGDDIRIKRGLLERREIAIPIHRLQAIRIVESLPRQLFGYAAIYIESAGHAEEKGVSTQLHPFIHHSKRLALLGSLAPEFAIDAPFERPPRRALARFLVKPLLLTVAITAAMLPVSRFAYLGFVAFIPVILLGLRAHRDTGIALTDTVAVIRSRRLERQTAIVPRNRIQFAATEQSLLQRRLEVASCILGAASGAGGKRFEARDIEACAASRFLAWLSARPAGINP